MGVFETAPVIDLLVLDETNPRSIAHQIATLKARAAAAARHALRSRAVRDGRSSRRSTGIARHRRALTDIDAIGRPPALRTLVDLIQTRLAELSNGIFGKLAPGRLPYGAVALRRARAGRRERVLMPLPRAPHHDPTPIRAPC